MYDRKYLSKNPFDEHLPGKEDRYWANAVVKENLLSIPYGSRSPLYRKR